MTTQTNITTARRQLYMVLSPHSLPYASLAMDSLFTNSVEDVDLHLITDSLQDKHALADAVAALARCERHSCGIYAEEELDDAEATLFAGLPHLRSFRHGHPCWRKITDPVLLGKAGDELLLLDPDLYFPNKFRFEQTPETGLLLMWQRPNCLLPSTIVRRAMDCGIPLARHVDIGVSHWRAKVDLEWLDWLLGQLGGASLPRAMHVEAIVWAAIAMRQGGGYLDPKLWSCWYRSQARRVKRKLGVQGSRILASEHWGQMKCFHGGGEAKWWLSEALTAGYIPSPEFRLAESRVLPYVELTRAHYEKEQSAKGLLRSLGYYRLFGAQHA